jgi:ParB family chromosome partitioning protein
MAKLPTPNTAGFNAGNRFSKMFKIDELIIDPEFSGLFPINESVKNEIVRKMKESGYDENEPVCVWKGKNIIVDGHTRHASSKEAGLKEIPGTEKEFKDRDEVLLYMFERQAVRRNLSGAEILLAVKIMIKDGKNKNGKGRAAEQVAKRLGFGLSTVYHAKALNKAAETADEGDEVPAAILNDVKTGKKSVNKGYSDLIEHQNGQKPAENEFYITNAHGLPKNVEFLKSAVILLAETKLHINSPQGFATLLVNHFLKKNERDAFYKLLPETVQKELDISVSVPVH